MDTSEKLFNLRKAFGFVQFWSIMDHFHRKSIGNQWSWSFELFHWFFVCFHIVCDRYTSDYAHFTFFIHTIWPLSLSSDFGTRSCTHTDTASLSPLHFSSSSLVQCCTILLWDLDWKYSARWEPSIYGVVDCFRHSRGLEWPIWTKFFACGIFLIKKHKVLIVKVAAFWQKCHASSFRDPKSIKGRYRNPVPKIGTHWPTVWCTYPSQSVS